VSGPIWIEHEVVLAVHSRQLAEHGGAPGVRDKGLLESALEAPRNRFLYQHSGVEELAACYAYHLVRNHPFVDGNKRTAYVCLRLFLRLNGWDLAAEPHDKVRTVESLAAGRITLEELAVWVKSRLHRL
jgi:death-on-curing protein